MGSQPVVIVNGSSSIKAGFGGEDVPFSVFGNLTGKPQYPAWLARCELIKTSSSSLAWAQKRAALKETFVGDDAQELRGVLSLHYPMDRGVVQNWEAMEQVWQHTFQNELKIRPSDHNILMTEAPLNATKHRTKMFQIMFERFKVPALYVENPAWLALMSAGRKTGLVLHVGDGVSHVLAIYEGYEIVGATQRMNLGGKDVTRYLSTLLQSSGNARTFDYEVVKDLKEDYSFVSQDLKQDKELADRGNKAVVREAELPDGQSIFLGAERFKCNEVLFTPSLIGSELDGIQDFLLKALSNCEMDIRQTLLNNIVISGGSSVAPGFIERFRKELKLSLPNETAKFKVADITERKYSSWIGGSVLSSLTAFQQQWVTKREYQEHGDSVIFRKCNFYGAM